MTQSMNPMNAPDPAALELDAQLDLLVDDELPEDDRRTLLTAMDRNPAQWRQVATRFLERQTERKAVRQFIAAGARTPSDDAQSIPPTYSFRSRSPSALINWLHRPHLRSVAAMIVVGVLSAYGGVIFGPHGANIISTGDQAQAASFSTDLPVALTGSADPQQKVSVEVPIVASDKLPAGYPFDDTSHEAQGSRHVVIMPWGDGRAVMFPVNTTVNAEFH